jgi:putative membrane protein
MDVLIAYLHHLAAFTLVAAIVAELVLLQLAFTQQIAHALRRADLMFGVAAALILLFGTMRMMAYEKGVSYYLHSGPFLLKLSLFVLVGLLSIFPTLVFLKWRRALALNQLPVLREEERKRLMSILYLELFGIALIILNAVLAAKGIGF